MEPAASANRRESSVGLPNAGLAAACDSEATAGGAPCAASLWKKYIHSNDRIILDRVGERQRTPCDGRVMQRPGLVACIGTAFLREAEWVMQRGQRLGDSAWAKAGYCSMSHRHGPVGEGNLGFDRLARTRCAIGEGSASEFRKFVHPRLALFPFCPYKARTRRWRGRPPPVL